MLGQNLGWTLGGDAELRHLRRNAAFEGLLQGWSLHVDMVASAVGVQLAELFANADGQMWE